MSEFQYHVKWSIRIHWGVFALAVLLIVIGLGITFAPITEKVYLYSDEYYNYYTEVTTYPYIAAGMIIETLGWLAFVVSFFASSKD